MLQPLSTAPAVYSDEELKSQPFYNLPVVNKPSNLVQSYWVFVEIPNDFSDIDRIKFQEDTSLGTKAPNAASQQCTSVESSNLPNKSCSMVNETRKKEVNAVGLTLENSSDGEIVF
ncbi:hypothetical protein HPG69_001604 [Diceros bicornis minor]|uniref:Uncharacterized protein n=1 Tax=Diceros bicornis minor TaxID=77932 RepID=A0A7J7FGA6_DICBM|nr:hypothetical protein HPG69_001604 [Diceros bicornis minor]